MRLFSVLVTQTNTEVFWSISYFINLLVSLVLPVFNRFGNEKKRAAPKINHRMESFLRGEEIRVKVLHYLQSEKI